MCHVSCYPAQHALFVTSGAPPALPARRPTADEVAEALVEVVNGRRRRKKRKRPAAVRASRREEVRGANPFKKAPATTTWAIISKNNAPQLVITSKCGPDRTLHLLDYWIKVHYGNPSCTDGALATKKELL